MSGQTVTFSISPDNGTLSFLGDTSTYTTSDNGRVAQTLVLGSDASGSYTVTASVGSVSVSRTATVGTSPRPPDELSIVAISSPGAGQPGDALTFVVEVRADGSPSSGQTMSFSVSPAAGAKALSITSAITGSNGRGADDADAAQRCVWHIYGYRVGRQWSFFELDSNS